MNKSKPTKRMENAKLQAVLAVDDLATAHIAPAMLEPLRIAGLSPDGFALLYTEPAINAYINHIDSKLLDKIDRELNAELKYYGTKPNPKISKIIAFKIYFHIKWVWIKDVYNYAKESY